MLPNRVALTVKEEAPCGGWRSEAGTQQAFKECLLIWYSDDIQKVPFWIGKNLLSGE